MDVTFSDEQGDLRQVVRDVLDRHRGPLGGDGAPSDPAGYDTAAWLRLSGELGLTGLTVPQRYGGAGASTVELGIVLAELGRTLTPVPFLQTAVAGTVLAENTECAASADLAAEVLPAIAQGTLIAGLAPPDGGGDRGYPTATRTAAGLRVTGQACHVVDGPLLGLLITPVLLDGTPVLAAVRLPADGALVEPLPTLDRTRPQAHITLSDAPAVELGDAAATSRAVDLLLVAVAVESAGAARYCLDSTVRYLRTREQFGRPIGSFQALQHRCADLAVAVESATSTAWYASWAAGADPAGLAVAAPLAKAHCAQVFRRVAGEMIQLHGGIGFTWEHPAHRYFKRATSTDLLFGGRFWVRRLVAERAGLS